MGRLDGRHLKKVAAKITARKTKPERYGLSKVLLFFVLIAKEHVGRLFLFY